MGISVLLIAVVSHTTLSQAELFPDAEVISECIAEADADVAKHVIVRGSSDVVYVVQKGETTAMIGQSQLASEHVEWADLAESAASMRTRAQSAWSPPASISARSATVRNADPPTGQDGAEARFYSFWPPGYSRNQDGAIVRAWVGPTPHGAVVTCQLKKSDGQWYVVKHWLAIFA